MMDGVAIGPYRVLQPPLGKGGMGTVYRARHAASERVVALKTVSAPGARWFDSIRREIQALTRIRHPGVVRIVDHGVHEGIPWYAMNLLEGESLRHFGQRIWSPFRRPTPLPVHPTELRSETEDLGAGGAVPEQHAIGRDGISTAPPSLAYPAAAGELDEVLRIARRICATLAFLHGEGFVNCDLKPENIVLVASQPVLIDFGLAARHAGGTGRESLEAQQGMAGTLPYMSPEQIRREFVDARSDLYSLACILYELVAGVPPFSGQPWEILHAHQHTEPTPPSALAEGIPRVLDDLILRLMAKNVADRFGYADEVATLLGELVGDTRRLSDFPPARSYLYRAAFVGREQLMNELVTLGDRAIGGSGALVLLGGESGVGKTRLVMELTRTLPHTRMRVVTSEASPMASDGRGAVSSTPLHAVRPLLQCVADCCQEGGTEVTERLIGARRDVLAAYEPLLAHLPAGSAVPSRIPLSAEASRRRLFQYVAEVLAALAYEEPLLWVIDDLGWTDELSLAFLQSLDARYFESVPVLIVGTYRSEEVSRGTLWPGAAPARGAAPPRTPGT